MVRQPLCQARCLITDALCHDYWVLLMSRMQDKVGDLLMCTWTSARSPVSAFPSDATRGMRKTGPKTVDATDKVVSILTPSGFDGTALYPEGAGNYTYEGAGIARSATTTTTTPPITHDT